MMILIGKHGGNGTKARMYSAFDPTKIKEEEVQLWRTTAPNDKRDPISHRNREAYFLSQKERPFIAWDGEGITYPGSRQQSYVLFACSTGDRIVAKEGCGLSTEECLNLLFRVESKFPNAYHVGFGFSYDINQILTSFSRIDLRNLARRIRQGKAYRWRGIYTFWIKPGKSLQITRNQNGNKSTVRIYDTFGFFQRRFVDVVRAYFPTGLSSIESGKANRAVFQYSEIDEITRYCLAENALLVTIMDRLRDNFEERGLHLREWHGPGAVASASLKLHGIKEHLGVDIPTDVRRASQLAYQGGRFELLRAGVCKENVYQYDINSAYPSAIINLPSLRRGRWEYVNGDSFETGVFGVWHLRYGDKRTDRYDRLATFRAQPYFYRDSHGRITYPYRVEGWYWNPEAELTLLLDYPCEVEIIEGWVFRPDTDIRPFAYVEDIYYERLELKKQGDGLERVLKLEINSLYGKLAQRAGWYQKGDRIPAYHQLEWAGYITSATRAKLFRAYLQCIGGIFAFETDAIFSTRPLNLPCGENLGEWAQTNYTDILYLQSGFYFAHPVGGGITEHYRGFDKGSLNYEQVYNWLDSLDPTRSIFDPSQPRLFGTTKRFIGFKRALASRQSSYWRSWETSNREITIGREGKRKHSFNCPQCLSGRKWTDCLHGLVVNQEERPGENVSQRHRVPWDDEIWDNPWAVEDELSLLDGRIL
jgi:hypothetical protein